MGVFGTGSFDNDDALDWARTLEESRGLKVLKRTLREVLDAGDGVLEAQIALQGMAAAEVVAGLNDSPADDLPEEIETWIEEQRGRSETDLSPLALEALERIQVKCELIDQLKKCGEYDVWIAVVKDLEQRLNGDDVSDPK
ncbi:MAG: DUF4259 domain-containing protein [Planctomycetes bacterium]|nr:DUF4259 domain-containing protein [Planctomycetota bacterium]